MQGAGDREFSTAANTEGWLGSRLAEPPANQGLLNIALGARTRLDPNHPPEINYRLRPINQAAGAKPINRSEVGSGTNDVTVPLPTP